MTRRLLALALPFTLAACGGEDASPGADTGGIIDTGNAVDTAVDTGNWSGPDIQLPDTQTGTGECPTPVAGCVIVDGESAALSDWLIIQLGQSLDCTGTHSFPIGGIDSFEWSVQTKPDESALPTTLGTSDGPTIGIEPDVSGRYVFALEVVGDNGVRSCEPDTVEVNVEAIPSTIPPLTVTLSWGEEPPAGEEPPEIDLDLHLLRDDAAIGTNGDCSPDNRTPDWGEEGDAHNPSHSGNVTTAPGTEFVGIRAIEPGARYTGVVFGVAFPTDAEVPITEVEASIEVRVAGEPIGVFTETITPGEQWDAFTVTLDEDGGYQFGGEGSGEGSGG